MINYTLPDFTVGLGLNLFFVRLQAQRPDWFQDGVRIDSVYGCFPACNLNGGRAFLRERTAQAQMEETFALLAEEGVKARLTLTNMLATEADLHDEYLNAILSTASRYEPKPSCTPTSWPITCASATVCAACYPPRAPWRTSPSSTA